MKKLISVLFILTAILSVFGGGASAATYGTTENGLRWGTEDGEAYIRAYWGDDGVAVVIPSEIEGYPVTSILERAFYEEAITGITIPDSVKSIGEWAFYNCDSLEKVTLGAGIDYMGSGVFNWCDNLQSVTFSDGITYIGDYAFNQCNKLTGAISIPDSVTYIGKKAFADCHEISSLRLSKNANISDDAFYYCYNITSLNIPEGVTTIGARAFQDCAGIQSVTFPASLKSIGEDAFYGAMNVKTVTIKDLNAYMNIDFANYLSTCKGTRYYNSKVVTKVTIPEGTTEIKPTAFCQFTDLKSIEIPDSVTSIGDYAFRYCSSLEDIDIPDRDCDKIGLNQ